MSSLTLMPVLTRLRRLLAVPCLAIAAQAAADSGLGADSNVAEAGDCEAEVSFDRTRSQGQSKQRERSLRLACGIGWRTEIEAAFARQREADARVDGLAVQIKTSLRDHDDRGRIGWAIALGAAAERSVQTWQRSEYALGVEATRQFGAAWLAEVSFGTVRDVRARRDSTFRSLALEYELNPRLELRGTVGGDDRGRPLTGVGLRYALWPDVVQLKLSYALGPQPAREQRAGVSLQLDF